MPDKLNTTGTNGRQDFSLMGNSEQAKRHKMASLGLDQREQDLVLSGHKGDFAKNEFGKDMDDVDFAKMARSNASFKERQNERNEKVREQDALDPGERKNVKKKRSEMVVEPVFKSKDDYGLEM